MIKKINILFIFLFFLKNAQGMDQVPSPETNEMENVLSTLELEDQVKGAMRTDNAELFACLAEKSLKLPEDLNEGLIEISDYSDSPNCIQLLIDRGASVNHIDMKTPYREASPLWIALNKGHFKTAEILFQNGANVDAEVDIRDMYTRTNRQTMLAHFVSEKDLAKTCWLLAHHANPNIYAQRTLGGETQIFTPLWKACEENGEDIPKIVTELVHAGSLINFRGGWQRFTPLFNTAVSNNTTLLKILLKHHANKEITDCYGKKAIDFTGQNAENFQLLSTQDPDSLRAFCEPRGNVMVKLL